MPNGAACAVWKNFYPVSSLRGSSIIQRRHVANAGFNCCRSIKSRRRTHSSGSTRTSSTRRRRPKPWLNRSAPPKRNPRLIRWTPPPVSGDRARPTWRGLASAADDAICGPTSVSSSSSSSSITADVFARIVFRAAIYKTKRSAVAKEPQRRCISVSSNCFR